MRSRLHAYGAALASLMIPTAVFFFSCSSASADFWGDNTRVLPATYRPAPHGVLVDKTKFYKVEVTCDPHVSSATQISEGLFIKNSKFVSHTLWLSDAQRSENSIPSNPTKLINVFSFTKDSNGQIVDATNGDCTETFLLPGTARTLTVAYAVTDANTPTPLGQVISDVAKIFAGIVPIFVTGPLLKPIVSGATSVAGTADPVKDLIGALNGTPQKIIRSYDLVSGKNKTTIKTDYSSVTLTVTPIDDISTQVTGNSDLRISFFKTLDSLAGNYLGGITAANAADHCANFVNTLQKYYTFGRKDISFIVGYFAQSAFPATLENRMTCIGNKFNAQDIVDYQFFYNEKASGAVGALHPLTQDAINGFSWDSTNRVLLSAGIASPYTEGLTARLAIYAQSTDDATRTKNANTLLKWTGSAPITIQDLSARFWSDPSVQLAATTFTDKLAQSGFQKFGCIFLKPTVGSGAFDAVFLAAPLRAPGGSNAQYSLSDLVAIRVILLGTGKSDYTATVSQAQITDDTAAIYEAASANHGSCNSVTVNLNAPKAQPASLAGVIGSRSMRQTADGRYRKPTLFKND